ncbi:MAG: phosphatidate cytidylyltransferase, partial [Actinomycetota bacterium]
MVDEDGPQGPDDRRRDPRPSQRIRIVGADSGDEPEADPGEVPDQPAPAESGDPGDPNKFGAIPKISADGPPPPGVDDTDQAPTQAVPTVGADSGGGEADGGDELPHWTDPPSGQVPRVDPEGEDDLDVWAGLSTGPQWKGEGDENAAADDFSDLHETPTVAADPGDPGVTEPVDDGPPTVSIDDLADPVAPGTVESAAGPPQRPSEPVPPEGDPYPPHVEQAPVAAAADSGGRDMNTAIMVGVGLVVAAGICFFLGSTATIVLVTVIITLAAAEFYNAVRKAGYHPIPIVGLVGTASLPLAAYLRGEAGIPIVLVLAVGVLIAWWMLDLSHDRAVPNIAITLFGMVYIGLFGAFAALLLKFPDGIGMLVGAVVVTVAHDVGGLFLGQRFGATQLSASSPNKTLEGFLGGVGSAVVAAIVI